MTIPNIWENKKWQPNHQPVLIWWLSMGCAVESVDWLSALFKQDRFVRSRGQQNSIEQPGERKETPYSTTTHLLRWTKCRERLLHVHTSHCWIIQSYLIIGLTQANYVGCDLDMAKIYHNYSLLQIETKSEESRISMDLSQFHNSCHCQKSRVHNSQFYNNEWIGSREFFQQERHIFFNGQNRLVPRIFPLNPLS